MILLILTILWAVSTMLILRTVYIMYLGCKVIDIMEYKYLKTFKDNMESIAFKSIFIHWDVWTTKRFMKRYNLM